MRGVLLIAVGSNFYGCMAYNMAVSIKLSSDVPITLITDGGSLDLLMPHQKEIFNIINPDFADFSEEGKFNPLKLKTLIYDYTPYDETLYLDVDGLFLNQFRNIDDLFKELKGDFQIYEVRRHSFENADNADMVWTKDKKSQVQSLKGAWDFYDIPKDRDYPEGNSSFVWFRKSKENKKYFARVAKNYDRRFNTMDLGGRYPDDLAWNCSSAQLNHYSEVKGYRPIFFNWTDSIKNIEQIAQKHWFLGMAAGFQPTKLLSFYDGMARTNMMKHEGTWSRDFKFVMNRKLYFAH